MFPFHIVLKIVTFFAALALAVASVAAPPREILIGFAQPLESCELAFSESGKLAALHVKLGDAVTAGEVVAEYDTRALKASLEIAAVQASSTARIEAAAAKRTQAQQRLESTRLVQESGHSTDQELLQAETDFVVAEAEWKLAGEEQLKHARELVKLEAEVEQRIARSPIEGVVIQLHRRVGEFLSPTEPTIASIARLDWLRAKFFVMPSLADDFRNRDTLSVMCDQRRTTAKIEYVAPVINPNTGTVRVDVLIDNRNGLHRAGAICRLNDVQFDSP